MFGVVISSPVGTSIASEEGELSIKVPRAMRSQLRTQPEVQKMESQVRKSCRASKCKNAAKMLQKCCKNVAKMLQKCCKNAANMLQKCCKNAATRVFPMLGPRAEGDCDLRVLQGSRCRLGSYVDELVCVHAPPLSKTAVS